MTPILESSPINRSAVGEESFVSCRKWNRVRGRRRGGRICHKMPSKDGSRGQQASQQATQKGQGDDGSRREDFHGNTCQDGERWEGCTTVAIDGPMLRRGEWQQFRDKELFAPLAWQETCALARDFSGSCERFFHASTEKETTASCHRNSAKTA
jgi:hypothetical protein